MKHKGQIVNVGYNVIQMQKAESTPTFTRVKSDKTYLIICYKFRGYLLLKSGELTLWFELENVDDETPTAE
jgi:hypothetical protein